MKFKKMLLGTIVLSIAVSLCFVPKALSQFEVPVGSWADDLNHNFGYSVSGGCDLNGDGVTDVVVGAPLEDVSASNVGRVYVYSGADHSVICILTGESSLNQFGFSVKCGSDWNDDGKPDLLVGAPGYNSYRGKVYVYSGDGSFTLLHTFLGEATGDKFGFSVSGAGDANADGYDDIIIGAPGGNWSTLVACGRIYLYRGSPWTELWDDHGETSHDSMGYSVSGGCDINNDGYDDIIVGAPYYDGVLKTDNGRAYVLSGINPTPALCWKYGEQSYDHLGWSVSCVGFYDDDNRADFIIGAPGYNDSTGKAYVCEYAPLIPPLYLTVLCDPTGGQTGDKFGWSVADAGDVNDDGRADVIIGAPGAISRKGKAYVYLGPGCTPQCVFSGTYSSGRLGFSVSSAGDLHTEDNRDDLIVGAPFASIYGRAYAYSGYDCSQKFILYPLYPRITITAPPGDTCIQSGVGYTIRWTSPYTEFFPYVDMRYSLNSGSSWFPWINDIPNNGSYIWSVPDTCTNNGLIEMRIANTCLNVSDTSDTFSINRLSVISPNGGELFCTGYLKYINWDPCCFPGNVKIVLTSDSCHIGDTVLVQSTPNDGEDSLIWPCFPSARCKVKILDATTEYLLAQSQSSFITYRPGDACGNCTVDVGDITCLLNYLYGSWPPPCPKVAGDCNCDGIIGVGDVVCLITYLYKNGPPPLCCTSSPALERAEGFNLEKEANAASVGLSGVKVNQQDEFEIILEAKSPSDVAGMDFEISFDPQTVTLLDPVLTSRMQGFQIFSSAKNGILKMGIVDLTGKNLVPAGEGPLVILKGKGSDLGSIQIHSAILVDRDAINIPVEIIGEVNKGEISDTKESSAPKDFSLSQNLPNPFNPETQISYDLPNASQVKLCIYNLLGQKVRTLVDEQQSAGHKAINWDGKDDRGNELASGVYFYRIQAGDFTDAMKMIMMK